MDLNPTVEQAAIKEAVANFLEKEVPFDAVQRAGHDLDHPPLYTTVWRRCAELGWFGLGIPEERGGVGYGVPEEVLLVREIGRHLTPGPFVSTILAAHVADRSDDPALLAAVLAGEVKAGLAIGDLVLDGAVGDLALNVGEQTAELVEVTAVEPLVCVDPTVRLGRALFGSSAASAPAKAIAMRSSLLHAAAALGIAEAVLHESVEYAKARHQFGRPIGSFQAVKHRCSDMAMDAYSAYAQLAAAAVCLADSTSDCELQVDAATLLCLRAARRNTARNIQNHGGIGFTDEHSAGWFLKRSEVLAHSAGNSRERVRRIVSAPRVDFT